MSTFYIKQGDTSPSMLATLKDGQENVIDLTSTTVKFLMRNMANGNVVVNRSALLADEDGGIVRYDWVDGDTDTVGSFQVEFEVTYSDGSVETFPNNGYIRVEIIDDIA